MQRIIQIAITFSIMGDIAASELIFYSPSGTEHHLDISSQESFEEVINRIKLLKDDASGSGTFTMEVQVFPEGWLAKSTSESQHLPRDYYTAIDAEDQENIAYLLNALAFHSLIKLYRTKSALNDIGKQIEHLHPLRFLHHVFTHDELIVCMRNLKGRSWVWKEFLDGVVDSFRKESGVNNITFAQIYDLAASLKMDPKLIEPYTVAEDWEGLIYFLIQVVPRNQDSKRYDM